MLSARHEMQCQSAQRSQLGGGVAAQHQSSQPWLQPSADLGDVGLGGQTDHDVQLLQLHVDGVIVFHKEDLHFVLQDLRPGGKIRLSKEQKSKHKPCEKTSNYWGISGV